jgi:hypothetical protein
MCIPKKLWWTLFALSIAFYIASWFVGDLAYAHQLHYVFVGMNLVLLVELIPIGRHNWRVVRAGKDGKL